MNPITSGSHSYNVCFGIAAAYMRIKFSKIDPSKLTKDQQMALSKIIMISTLSLASLFYQQQKQTIHTDRAVLLFDAGETNALLPVLNQWEQEGVDFRVIVTGTAETLVKPGTFGAKRLTLSDLGIRDQITQQTDRTTPLSEEALQQLKSKLNPKMVLVGTASKVQEQFLRIFPGGAAFVDNFNYDPSATTFKTVKAVVSAASHVFYPAENVRSLFPESDHKEEASLRKHYVSGKPSLEVWKKEISATDKTEVLKKLGFTQDKPIVTFIGGYGAGYDVVNPLFKSCTEKLKEQGYQVIMQQHPKIGPSIVKTPEALAVSDFIVGYNSSVIFEAALIGKNALFMIPKEAPYSHFAIEKGLLHQVENVEELLSYMKQGKKPVNLQNSFGLPTSSTEVISTVVSQILNRGKVGGQ